MGRLELTSHHCGDKWGTDYDRLRWCGSGFCLVQSCTWSHARGFAIFCGVLLFWTSELCALLALRFVSRIICDLMPCLNRTKCFLKWGYVTSWLWRDPSVWRNNCCVGLLVLFVSLWAFYSRLHIGYMLLKGKREEGEGGEKKSRSLSNLEPALI